MKELATQEVKDVQLQILRQVDGWCKAHQVQYFLGYGTLLGAVRHQGYIPWDDDIDIVMLRPDYERLIREFNAAAPAGLEVLHFSTDQKFPYEFAKVHDTRTVLVEDVGMQYEMGINIDVFVLDSLPDAEHTPGESIRRNRLWEKLLTWHLVSMHPEKKRSPLKQCAVAVLKALACCVPMQCCTRAIDRNCRSYAAPANEYVADLCQRWFRPSEVMRREWFSQSIELSFEGLSFPVPVWYDKVLTAWYGDYMQLPPPEERVTHHSYKAYAE